MNMTNLQIMQNLIAYQEQIKNSNNNIFSTLLSIKQYIADNDSLKTEYNNRLKDVEQIFQNKEYMKKLQSLFKIVDKLGYTPTNLFCSYDNQKLLNTLEVKLLFNFAIARTLKEKISNKRLWLIFDYLQNNYYISNFDFFIFGISLDIFDNNLDDNTVNILKLAAYSMLSELIQYAKTLKNEKEEDESILPHTNLSGVGFKIFNYIKEDTATKEIAQYMQDKSKQHKTTEGNIRNLAKKLGYDNKPLSNIKRYKREYSLYSE